MEITCMNTLIKRFIDFVDLFVYFCLDDWEYGNGRFSTSFFFGTFVIYGTFLIDFALRSTPFCFPVYFALVFGIATAICIFKRYNIAFAKYRNTVFKWYMKLYYRFLFFVVPLIFLMIAVCVGALYE